jgi:hypothetical protein
MDQDNIQVPYCRGVEELVACTMALRSAAEFFAVGSVALGIPRIEVEGVGLLGFPLTEFHIRALIGRATPAPYGRGSETILDESVRKVWQLPATDVRLGGKAWDAAFGTVISEVTRGLGCAAGSIRAELYKLLVYPPGGFFGWHRDTEKTDGMLATLVLVLPSAHRGGELIIRHQEREVTAQMGSEDPSELRYAAFFADCEHELRPVTEGHRVCLVFNLVRVPDLVGQADWRPPTSAEEMGRIQRLLEGAFSADGAPRKLVWLLEHQYTKASLSLTGLKGADAGLVRVLGPAARMAGLTLHLCQVHIHEEGAAEPGASAYRRRRGGWYDGGASDFSVDPSASFEVIEVSDRRWELDSWVDGQDRPSDLGTLVLGEEELLPAGALDGVPPDEQRLLEATGNEGVSFERAYHRAAVVLWPADGFVRLLAQAGLHVALPQLAKMVGAKDPMAAVGVAEAINTWRMHRPGMAGFHSSRPELRVEMLELLCRLGDVALLKRFIVEVVAETFDGAETDALIPAFRCLGPGESAQTFGDLIGYGMPKVPAASLKLLMDVCRPGGRKPDEEWRDAWNRGLDAVAEALPRMERPGSGVLWQEHRAMAWDPKTLGRQLGQILLGARDPGWGAARASLVRSLIQAEAVIDPVTVMIPVLQSLWERGGEASTADTDACRLWKYSAGYVLSRSEFPPVRPKDWRQAGKLTCRCQDCAELAAFAANPVQREMRFKMAEARRRHIEAAVQSGPFEMTCETERTGSPRTLVCIKVLRSYAGAVEQHCTDVAAMRVLLGMAPGTPASLELERRLIPAAERSPDPV